MEKLELKPSFTFLEIRTASENSYGGVYQDRPRTFDAIIGHLAALNTHGELPTLKASTGCNQDGADEVSADAENSNPRHWN